MKRYFYTDKNTDFWEKEISAEKFQGLFKASTTADRAPSEAYAAIWSIDDPEDMGTDADGAILELYRDGGQWISVPAAYQPSGKPIDYRTKGGRKENG